MVRTRKEKKATNIELRQPDRSGPTEKTLLQIAEDQNLFNLAAKQQRKNKGSVRGHANDDGGDGEDEDGLSSSADRFMDTLLYAVCLGMLHFTLDFLVQHQYAMEIEYKSIIVRAFQALLVFAALVHALHPHPANTTLSPLVSQTYQYGFRQAIFFATSISAGCYLIYITNKYSYIAVLKQSPPLGCLWIWSVLEMNLGLSVLSLVGCYGFFWQNGYQL
ncbi:hypothetical protein N0V93_005837 [Gnomoniopsis smithogilvyi]|uniref:DUF7719 domain-containing protein n=1 Tax=Gnomoniopsis smithogilvyi TaxID=1191159 RepID=A0A9W8YTJ2_9PEZI|nr:hypothetical protein N0V93_005837 [Gnomoniopsis smithogilvyi]